MTTSETRVPTQHASRYLQQLCKHWTHKFTVEFDPQDGRIDLGEDRTVILTAQPEALTLRLLAPTGDTMDRLESVVADHVTRFAFREELVFDWVRAD